MGYATDDQLDLASLLRELRVDSGLSLRVAAPRADLSAPVLSRIENGQRPPGSIEEIEKLLDGYGTSGEQRARALQLTQNVLAEQERTEHWSDAYVDLLPASYVEYIKLEDEAESVTEVQINGLPGLLQTERYARAITQRTYAGSAERVEDLVAVRLKRQERLRGESPLLLNAIFTEAALRTQAGSPQLMHQQMQHLAVVARWPRVDVIVIPFSTAVDAALASTFTLFEGVGGRRPDRPSRAALVEQGAVVTRTITTDDLFVSRARRVIQRLRHAGLDADQSRKMIDVYVEYWGTRD
ncbi:helix-turn-helix domain-containing protein [Embleya sp. NPDC059237]|uniref:helix-turn-helix domain-containing protein n=1 Tax=Embleya sp. NPDC059237 TaxID=3346784 RepID=UPI0036A1A7B6